MAVPATAATSPDPIPDEYQHCAKRGDLLYCLSLSGGGGDPRVRSSSKEYPLPKENNWKKEICENPTGRNKGVYRDRFHICFYRDVCVWVIRLPTFKTIGTATFVIRGEAETSGVAGGPVSIEHTITRASATGLGSTASLRWGAGMLREEGSISVTGKGPTSAKEYTFLYKPNQPAGVVQDFDLLYSARAVLKGGSTNSVLFDSPPLFRCDGALKKGTRPGCVSTGKAIYAVGRGNKTYYAHVRAAIKSGLPSTLTRTMDSSLIDENRKIACRRGVPSPRPEGKECDEYPFASTQEGASSDEGPPRSHSSLKCGLKDPDRTGPGGFSRCLIDANHNNAGGTELRLFYDKQRILDGEKFDVRV